MGGLTFPEYSHALFRFQIFTSVALVIWASGRWQLFDDATVTTKLSRLTRVVILSSEKSHKRLY